MPYVTEGGFGSFSRDPSKIADTISYWLQNDKLLAEMSSRAKEASRPKVLLRIVLLCNAILYYNTNAIITVLMTVMVM